jgi:tetratricopeptide (TPR) repeat protein
MEITDSGAIPEKARQLHQQGRLAGQDGDYDRALELLGRAHAEAPDWAYPVYDAAFTHLLKGDIVQAEKFYAKVDQMEPRGFFTCKTTLDVLRRELSGALPEGIAHAFVMLEFLPNREQKKAILDGLVQRFPDFAQAWRELSSLLDDPEERLYAIDRGLEGNPDHETRGQLLLNKALLLHRRGDRDEAVRILRLLTLDPDSTLSTVSLAKSALNQMLPRSGPG